MRGAPPVVIASLAALACGGPVAGRGAAPSTPAADLDLHVEGNELRYLGKPTRLLGVDHSGSEFVCIRGVAPGFFDGPDPDTLARSLLAWGHVNTVRLPLNEDCWLGINGVPPDRGGLAYRDAIVSYAGRLHAHGLFVIVDLHWSAPGSFPALGQQPMPDADHAPAFWASVARAFAGDPMTVLDLFNEPFVSRDDSDAADPWTCWADGCTITKSSDQVTGRWRAAGMRELLAAVRGAGARNVVMMGGLGYANDLTGWLAHVPPDPLRQTIASLHLYNFNPCAGPACWDAQLGPVAARVPIVTGELGEDDCAHGFIDTFLPWADAHRVSYLGWSWNPWDCSKGPGLISSYDGTPTGFGLGLRDHLRVTAP